MVMQTIPKKRCAIYTRKSVEEGLDQEFNSLDAQREAGEAYIASQKANGWVCLPTRYDDGGYSGGNMKRPALQQLLADCEAGLVDIIVVYKIDRLSRSICDFADLSKKFDEWGTQFVAVTQEINTATSAGRMMLNILITFAQYEREVITERVRDKMSASRKKGKWVGGRVPMGYRVENKKLTIVEEEARIIQRIFQRFIEVQSPALIAQELNKDGIRTKQGRIWNRQHIYRILSNHTYVGKVNYKNSICDGEQEAIIAQDVWDRTREILRVNDPAPAHMPRTEIIAPLKGILRCGHCDCAMMPASSIAAISVSSAMASLTSSILLMLVRPSLHNATKTRSQCATRDDCLRATRTTCDFCLRKSHVIPQSQDVQTADSTCADTEGKLRGLQQQDSQSCRGLSCLFQSWTERIYACAQICPRASITIREA